MTGQPLLYTPAILGLAAYQPRGPRTLLLDHVHEVLMTYVSHLPLTVRQVYYRLVATHRRSPKTQAFYKDTLVDCLSRARRAGLIRWDAIRDDGVVVETVGDGYGGLPDFADTVRWQAKNYNRDKRFGQARQIFVLCEAAGMVPQIVTALDGLPVTVKSAGGADSVTAKYDLARQCVRMDTTVFHVGDIDPTGLVIFHQIALDVRAMAADLCRQAGDPIPEYTCVRIAVLEEHIAEFGLLTGKVKEGDKSRRWYPGIGGDQSLTCEVEALPPDVLARLVRKTVEAEVDMKALQRIVEVEEIERARAIAAMAGVQF